MAGPTVLSSADRARSAGTLITAALDERPHRAPDFAAENHALHRLAQALTTSNGAVLPTLADMALTLCGAGSAGIGLLEPGDGDLPVLRWVALSGQCTGLANMTSSAEDSPDGVTLELGEPQLFRRPQRHFTCLEHVTPEVVEELVVPIPGEPGPWGTLWVMSHDERHHFDNEHRRILTSLANFTCAALTISRAKSDAEARAAEAEATRNALEQAEGHKDDFIAMLSHELRNPIAPIDDAVAAARRLAAGNTGISSALEIAERQIRLLKRLVGDLLDASRIRHGKLSVRPAYGVLQDIVADAVSAVRADVDNHQHRLHLSAPSYPVTVYADAARLTQVVANLLSNAVKYTPPGGNIILKVAVLDPDTRPTPESLRRDAVITVTDNGAGIPSELLPRVFDMFTQSASVSANAGGGLGIGLSVVKYLVNAHNGTVRIASEGEGRGTQAIVQLPIVCRPADQPAAEDRSTTKPVRILLVDDNADATEALGLLLSLEGHEVRRAQSGPDALFIVDSFAPDIALIDISMPGMDGRELAHQLRQRAQCSGTRLVSLTGYTANAGSLTDIEDEFDGHLVKPVSLDDLAGVLRR
ncbi:His Kinase A (phospho-acceptor) domain-containing protein [Burkholderia sp. D7]|nr:His Kinase A (phospho-acceptor) domain-containing protein [Burkholderia sp. D7]